jgi:hypothetical protein
MKEAINILSNELEDNNLNINLTDYLNDTAILKKSYLSNHWITTIPKTNLPEDSDDDDHFPSNAKIMLII